MVYVGMGLYECPICGVWYVPSYWGDDDVTCIDCSAHASECEIAHADYDMLRLFSGVQMDCINARNGKKIEYRLNMLWLIESNNQHRANIARMESEIDSEMESELEQLLRGIE